MKKLIIATVTVFTAIAFSAYTKDNIQVTHKPNLERIPTENTSDVKTSASIGRAYLGQAD